LREANLNPDEHLTDEQKELLLSADYLEKINAATAYFPTGPIAPNAVDAEIEEDDEEQNTE
jgi:hypothetical protein